MPKNPFTPAEIVSSPEDFFGRQAELSTIERSIDVGSIAIQGPVGIGKSSLLSKALSSLEGFGNNLSNKVIVCVAHSDIENVDDAARVVLEELVEIDEKKNIIKIGIPKFASYESHQAYNYYKDGKCLSALIKIVEDKAFKEFISNAGLIIIAVDEIDKAAAPFARLMRQISTKTQIKGIRNIRFAVAGISPYLDHMVQEDAGITRFIIKTLDLGTLSEEDANALVETKFATYIRSAEFKGENIQLDPEVIDRIAKLSGGHPHLIQLLGAHVIESEEQEPDGYIDLEDLTNSLKHICFEDRATVYDAMTHRLELEDKISAYREFIRLAGGRFPGRVPREDAQKIITHEELHWLSVNNFISVDSDGHYTVVDEFYRVRLISDEVERSEEAPESIIVIENQLIENGEIWGYGDDFFERNQLLWNDD